MANNDEPAERSSELRSISEAALDVLEKLGLADLPTREQIHREIEESLLSHPEKLPKHWLPSLQVYEQSS
jgi:hypothetical protein